MFTPHPDPDVRAAIVRLSDALCTWERETGRRSVLIVAEAHYHYRAVDGKPDGPSTVTDAHLLTMIANPHARPPAAAVAPARNVNVDRLQKIVRVVDGFEELECGHRIPVGPTYGCEPKQRRCPYCGPVRYQVPLAVPQARVVDVEVATAHVPCLLGEHPGWWATVTEPDVKAGDEVHFVSHGELVMAGAVEQVVRPGHPHGDDAPLAETYLGWWKIVYTPLRWRKGAGPDDPPGPYSHLAGGAMNGGASA